MSGASLRMYQALRRKWVGIADRFTNDLLEHKLTEKEWEGACEKARDRVSCRRQGIRRAVVWKAACAGWEGLGASGCGGPGEEVKLRENDGVCVTQVIYVPPSKVGPPKVQRKTAPRKG
jgi:hypothetical protein